MGRLPVRAVHNLWPLHQEGPYFNCCARAQQLKCRYSRTAIAPHSQIAPGVWKRVTRPQRPHSNSQPRPRLAGFFTSTALACCNRCNRPSSGCNIWVRASFLARVRRLRGAVASATGRGASSASSAPPYCAAKSFGTRERLTLGAVCPEASAASTDDAGASPEVARFFGTLEAVSAATGEDATGEDATGEDATGEDATGEDATGEDATGEDATGEDATGEDATGEDATGEDATVLRARRLTGVWSAGETVVSASSPRFLAARGFLTATLAARGGNVDSVATASSARSLVEFAGLLVLARAVELVGEGLAGGELAARVGIALATLPATLPGALLAVLAARGGAKETVFIMSETRHSNLHSVSLIRVIAEV